MSKARNPNHMDNLTPHKKGTPEAKKFSQMGVAAREEKRLQREAMKHAVRAFGNNKLETTEDLTAIDTLRIVRNLYITQEEWDKVVEVSKVLAEYEQPKKSRVEEVKVEVDFNDFSEEDVELYLSDSIDLDELRKRKIH